MTFDGKAFGAEIVTAVKAHVADIVGPILKRLDALDAALAALPTPKDGEPGKNADPEAIKEMIAETVAALHKPEDGQPGKDADPAEVAGTIRAEVEKAVAAIEKPKDGASVTIDELRPIIAESVSAAISGLPAAKDGVNLAGALIDRGGNLVLTLSDGSTRDLGLVVGKDAAEIDMAAVERSIVAKIDAIPKAENGKDGFGFDDMDLVEADTGIVLRFSRGGVVKDFPLPVVVDCGVYREGQSYAKGNGVTWGGSFWIAQEATDAKPDSGKGWRLAVKKGRDGRDGVVKTVAEKPIVKVG